MGGMKAYDVVLLTESRYLSPTSDTQYVKNLMQEDVIMRAALEKCGLHVTRQDWADPHFDWSTAAAVLFRTPWDYFDRIAEFRNWLERTGSKTRFINSLDLVWWNIDKHYLRDLANKGIRIPPTRFVERGESVTLRQICNETGWKEMILKPAVSAGARHTYRLHEKDLEQHEPTFRERIENEAMIIQPFLQNVLEHGEISLMVMNGTFTHSIRKVARHGDFRVQDDFGGTVYPYTATDEERRFAEHAFSVCDSLPLYGRVDIIQDNEGHPVVSELEIIEPELWFRFHPSAADILAEAVAQSILK